MSLTLNFADIFEAISDVIPERRCLATPSQDFTYRQVDDMSTQYAHAFAKQGVKQGDHIGYALYNKPYCIWTILGLLKLRASLSCQIAYGCCISFLHNCTLLRDNGIIFSKHETMDATI